MSPIPMHPADAIYEHNGAGVPIRDRRSPLKRVLDRTEINNLQSVVACPYGCKPKDQDRLGYCRHLIGFCENLKLKDGEVKSLPKKPIVVELLKEKPDRDGRRSLATDRGELKIGDFVLRIVSTLRVYRKPADEAVKPADGVDWSEENEEQDDLAILVEHDPASPHDPDADDDKKKKRKKATA